MPSMLEKAILDATELREAAMKNAEAAVIEKYASEVKQNLQSLLEQDEAVPGAESAQEVDLESTLEQVPMSHLEGEGDEEVVVVDLDDIMLAADDEDGEDAGLDREEIADEIGIELEDEPANRSDDEIELSEADLVDIFKETLVIDVPEVTIEQSLEELSADEKEEDEKVETIRTDGMNADDIEEYEKTMAKNESLQREVRILKKILGEAKNRLQNLSVENGRLFYINRVFSDFSLNEQQKNKIVDMIKKAQSVEEAKTICETLQRSMESVKANAPKSLSEVVTRKSSVILGGTRKETSADVESPTLNRWATLAGLKNN